jgi:hypothetical protein
MKNALRVLLVSCLCIFSSACTIMKTSNVMVGEKRPPLNITEVKLYTTPPAKYVEIAILSVDAGHDFKPDQTVMDEAVERVKQEAAALGANGVIITSLGEKGSGSSVGVGTGTSMINGGVVTSNALMVMTGQRFKNISGMAIFVTP